MNKFQIVLAVEKGTDQQAKKILSRFQYIYFKKKQKILFNLICMRLKRYKQKKDKADYAVFEEINEDPLYIQRQKRNVDDFLLMDYKDLKDENGDVKKLFSDRIVAKVAKKGLSMALKNVSVLLLLNKLGILIETKILNS